MDRICLKVLAKRASVIAVTSTARDMADDLRFFLAGQPDGSLPAGGSHFSATRVTRLGPAGWLTRKQRETRTGRAELQLEERSRLWSSKSENRFLPSIWEWANFRLMTSKSGWTESQREMMKRAGRMHRQDHPWPH